jgi:hypothetical protein
VDRDSAPGIQGRSPHDHRARLDQRTVHDSAVNRTAYSRAFDHIATDHGAGDYTAFDHGPTDDGPAHPIAVAPAQPSSDRHCETADHTGGSSGPQSALRAADQTVGLRATTASAAHQPAR